LDEKEQVAGNFLQPFAKTCVLNSTLFPLF